MPNKTLYLPIPPLFSFQECIWFLDRGYDECLYQVKENELTKAVFIKGKPVLFRIAQKDAKLAISILYGDINTDSEQYLLDYISEWFDMENNIRPFYDLLIQNETLAYMVAQYSGLRLMSIPDLFEALCWSIIGQQINLTFAYKLKRRLVEKYGSKIEYDNINYYLFPDAHILASASIADLREMQFSNSKAKYVIGIAQSFANGEISKEMIQALPDHIARQVALTKIKGIGVWTANYALMKSLREPSSIPYGDVGLLNALTSHQIIQARSEKEKIDAFFNNYKGFESYLVFYLWRSLSAKKL